MIDLGSLIAVGLSGFLAGAAYANSVRHRELVDTGRAGALVVDGRAYVLAPLKSNPPADPKPADPRFGKLFILPRKPPEDAA